MIRAILLIAVLAALCSSCSSVDESTRMESRRSLESSPEPVTGLDDTSFVMVGDSINLTVWGYPEFTTRTIVRPNGTITVPLLGQLDAGGRRRSEFSDNIKKALAQFIKGDYHVSVEIASPLPRITVLGSVGNPTSFAAMSEMTLLEALSTAGGWTDQSDLRFVLISRRVSRVNESPVVEVDLQMALQTGNLRALPRVQPGDVVFVPTRTNVVRELSEFVRDVIVLIGFFSFIK